MEIAFDATREQGGICVLAGNLPKGDKIAIDPFALINGKQIIGTCGGETVPDRDVPKLANLYKNGQLSLSALVASIYDFSEINAAFQELERGVPGRILVNLTSSS